MQRNLSYWIALVYRRKATALQVAGFVFGTILVGSLLWPPVYESTCEILVRDNRAELLVSPGLQNDAAGRQPVVVSQVTEQDLNSELELLTSTYLVKLALEGLREPARYAGPAAVFMHTLSGALSLPAASYRTLHGAPVLTPRDSWALKLASHLWAAVINRSDIIEVAFRSDDPRWSREFLDRLVNRYLEYHARISHDPQAEQFFQQQAGVLQAKLQRAEEGLRAYQVQTGITDLQAQKQALVDRLSDLQSSYSQAGVQLASTQHQQAFLASLLGKTPRRIDKETRQEQNQALQQLKPQVMQLQAERAQLLARYQPTSARIREIDAKLQAAQKILDTENHLEVRERSTDVNPIWLTIDSDLAKASAEVASSKASQDALTTELAHGKQELEQMVDAGVAIERLERQVATAKEAYLSYVRKSEEARAAQALNVNKILNVTVAQPPSEPLQAVFPKLWVNMAAGLLLAAVLGVGAAYWEDHNDPKLYSPVTIAEVSGLRTLAVLRDEP